MMQILLHFEIWFLLLGALLQDSNNSAHTKQKKIKKNEKKNVEYENHSVVHTEMKRKFLFQNSMI